MRMAFLLYKYFPYGGMQRDCLSFVRAVQERGHKVRIYCAAWQGEHLENTELRLVPGISGSSARRGVRFVKWVQQDLVSDPVDAVVGFNKMPGLDVYFAADPCYMDKAMNDRGRLYRRGGRFRHFSSYERAVFGPASHTRILMISEIAREKFEQYYHTPARRMFMLPPGVSPDHRRPADALHRRRNKREELGLAGEALVLLFVGSGFITKGLDRAVLSLAALRSERPDLDARLLVVGQDKGRRFQRQAKKLGLGDRVRFLGGRDDVPELMLASDLLVHPALAEAAGVVLLEALVAGLPVVVTDVCGYAHHVEAARAGIVLSSPFSQEALDRAVQRNIDGVFRAGCRHSALEYAEKTDLYSMHRTGAELIERLLAATAGRADG